MSGSRLSLRQIQSQQDRQILDLVRGGAEKERQCGENRTARSFSLSLARDRLFLQQVQDICTRIFKNKLIPSGFAANRRRTRRPMQRHVNLLLGDLHFGARVDARETAYPYSVHEEARRLAQVVTECCEYKARYRDETVLNVSILGDIIQNQLHDKRDGAPLAEQVASAMWLLSQAISFLAAHWPQVRVRVTTGNHGRNMARHEERATHQKWDSLENMIYFALKMAASQLPNVTVEIPYAPFFVYELPGHAHVFVTHGDTVLKLGNPHSRIDVSTLEKEVNRINAAMRIQHGFDCDVFVAGHVHIGMQIRLQNRVKVLTNGALIPPDAYTVSLGSLESDCGQVVWESVEGHPVGDYRFLEVNERTDQDQSLERIIAPFPGF